MPSVGPSGVSAEAMKRPFTAAPRRLSTPVIFRPVRE
jgi:hypothetical protein